MPDLGERYTEEALTELRKRLKAVYAEAQRDIAMKAASFEAGHRERVRKHRQEMLEGKITKDDFGAWMRGQVFQREAWEQKREQIAQLLVRADQQAQQMVNDSKQRVFAENANYLMYQTEKGIGVNASFGLYDQKAVTRLLRDDPDLLPRPRVDAGRDYAWYNRMVNNAVTQGIVQGEDLDEIMLRIANDSGERSMSAMMRNARTAYTGAQNAGRLQGMREVEKRGIRIQKEWAANNDGHTRDAHAELDGQRVDIDEPFDSMLGPIMCPGDPDADPANVYNCRCRLIKHFPDYPNAQTPRESVGDFERWKAERKPITEGMTSGVQKAAKDVDEWLESRQRARQKTEAARQKAEARRRAAADEALKQAKWVNGPRAGQNVREATATVNEVVNVEVKEVGRYYGDVQTDVHIPEERKDHMRSHHPEDYDQYIGYVEDAITNPKLILDDHRNANTAMFIGETNKDNINVIVKLAFTKDKDDRSFAVTMHPAGERTIKKLKKRFKEVYKRPKT